MNNSLFEHFLEMEMYKAMSFDEYEEQYEFHKEHIYLVRRIESLEIKVSKLERAIEYIIGGRS